MKPIWSHDVNKNDALALLQEGYLFIKNRVTKERPFYQANFLGKSVICISGEEAAQQFYNPSLFQRKGSIPKPIQKSFLGVDSIQSLDRDVHLHRKQSLLSFFTREDEVAFGKLISQSWMEWIHTVRPGDKIVMLEAASELLCRVSCEWTGIPLAIGSEKERTNDFLNMIDSFGTLGVRHWKGRLARKRTEHWITSVIEDVRSVKLKISPNTLLSTVANFRDLEGQLLPARVAAMDVISVVKSIVAVSIFIVFAVLALHEHPSSSPALKTGDEQAFNRFALEVRRFYPFAPFIGAIVKDDFTWKGLLFPKGELVLLDLYGTNHDSSIWSQPNQFRPERFLTESPNFYTFIPQGGGTKETGHRCPGEGFVDETIKATIDFFLNTVTYELPPQDMSYSFKRMPTYPKSGILMTRIQRVHKS